MSLEIFKYPKVYSYFRNGKRGHLFTFIVLTIRPFYLLEGFFHEFCFRVNFLLFSVIPKEVYTWPDI